MIELGSNLTTEETWRRLDAQLRPFVKRRVSKGDVDDVVQDVFLKVQRGLSSLRDDQRFGPWFYRVARSTVIDHHRAVARRPYLAGEGPEPEELQAEELDDDSVQREVALYAAVFIGMLPSPYQEALTLTELEGRTQKEAAELLGVSLSAMKSRVQRGREKLRKALLDCCHIALDARHRVIGCEPRVDGKLPDGCC